MIPLTLLLGVSCTCWSETGTPRVIYVDGAFAGENATGESWLSAYPSLQDAIDAGGEAGGAEIWVKAGIYKPDAYNRKSTFKLRPGIRILGGFRGTETRSHERNAKSNRTVLSGDIGKTGIDSDNSFHILTGCSDAILDGFIISRGNADGMDENGTGAGILVPSGTRTFSIINCTFEKNVAGWQGGAIFADHAQLALTNCTFYSNGSASGSGIATRGNTTLTVGASLFSSNYARNNGGAVHLTSSTRAVIADSTFLYNSSQGSGGALSAISDAESDLKIEIQGCSFIGNRAANNAGALFFDGKFSPIINQCQFEQNICMQGAGAIANQGGVVAVVTSSTFTQNKGAKDVENIGNDDRSTVVNDLESVASTQPEESTEEVPKRQLPSTSVFDSENNEHTLRELAGANKLAVFVLGELTDPDFIENYRDIEAIARDFAPIDVRFFYLYRYLSHPENNGYLQPFHQHERARQVQLVKELLKTKTPWLYDAMDNQSASELSPDNKNSVFVYAKTGEELFAGPLSDTSSLRNALLNLAGTPDTTSSASRFPSPLIKAINPLKPQLLDRIHFDPDKEVFLPLEITPMESRLPYYVKLRAEANDELLRTGDGKLYLGFHVDPLYQMQWNNEGEPLKYEIKSLAGIVAPSIGSAPVITEQAMDAEPREFILKTRQLDVSKPLMLQIQYSVSAPALKKSIEVKQQYLINLRQDPCGGQAYRRQISYKDASRIRAAASTEIPFELRHFDSNHDGKLTRNEVTGNLWTRFPDIDTNRDGYLNIEEYADYLRNK